MAALLNIVDLRRHAFPANFMTGFVPETSHFDRPRPPRGGSDHTRLLARWHIGTEGRPVCSWSVVGHEVRASPC